MTSAISKERLDDLIEWVEDGCILREIGDMMSDTATALRELRALREQVAGMREDAERYQELKARVRLMLAHVTDDDRYFWKSRQVRDPRAGWWALAATVGFLLIVLVTT